MPSVFEPTQRPYMHLIFRYLIGGGWEFTAVPEELRLADNRQRLELKRGDRKRKIRLSVYKVGRTGRGRPDERRIEITTTYRSDSFSPSSEFDDVVLGFDEQTETFVGVDPRRLKHGGETHNASTFLDKIGLTTTAEDDIIITARTVQVLPRGVEYHAFFKGNLLGEYFFNRERIHFDGDRPIVGNSKGDGEETGEVTQEVPDVLHVPDEVDRGRRFIIRERLDNADSDVSPNLPDDLGDKKSINPEELRRRRNIQELNGLLGELYVIKTERRFLRDAGLEKLAEKIDWVSQKSVSAGYDIASYTRGGDHKAIEVKSSSSEVDNFRLTENEWNSAEELEDSYWIYTVDGVRTDPSIGHKLRNPVAREKEGLLNRTPSEWLIELEGQD